MNRTMPHKPNSSNSSRCWLVEVHSFISIICFSRLIVTFCDSPIDNKRFIGCDYASSSKGRVCGARGGESDFAAEIFKLLTTEPEDRAFEILRLFRKGDSLKDTLGRVQRQHKRQIAMESRSCNEAQASPTWKSK